MLGVYFTFDVRTKEGQVLSVDVLEPKLVTVTDTNPRVVEIRINNPLDRVVSLTGFQTRIVGQGSDHVMVSVTDPSPFEIPARGSKIGHIELTALRTWPHRVSQTARTTARETPSAA